MSHEFPDDEDFTEAIKNHMKEHHITKGEALMSFWANFQEAAKGQTNEEQKKPFLHSAFYCLERVLDLDPNDPVFFKSRTRAEFFKILEKGPDYAPDVEVKKAAEKVRKAKERLEMTKAALLATQKQISETTNSTVTVIHNVIRDWMVLQSKKVYTNDIVKIGMRVLILPIRPKPFYRLTKVDRHGIRLIDSVTNEKSWILQDELLHNILYHLEGEEEVPVLYEGKIKNFVPGIDQEAVEISSTIEAYDGKIGWIKAVWSTGKIPVVNQETGIVREEYETDWDTVIDYWYSLPNHIFKQSKKGHGSVEVKFDDFYYDRELKRVINKNDSNFEHQMTWTHFWREFQDEVLARTNRNLDTNYTWENRPIGEMEDEYDGKTKKQYEAEFVYVRDQIVKEEKIKIIEEDRTRDLT